MSDKIVKTREELYTYKRIQFKEYVLLLILK